MSTLKFHPEKTFHDPERVALSAPGADIFGRMRRRINLPSQWAALAHRDGGAVEVTPAGGILEGAESDDVLFVRTSPIEVGLSHDSIAAADGFLGRFHTRFQVAVIAERGELEAFEKLIVGSGGEVRSAGVGQYFEPEVGRACREVAGRHEASALGEGRRDDVERAIAEAVQGACFKAGLALVDAPRVSFISEALDRARAVEQDAVLRRQEHEASQQLRDALQTARQTHLGRLSDTLARLKALSDESPDVDLPVLMRTFAEQERSDLYEALFATDATQKQTRSIVVATAGGLLFFDPSRPGEPERRVEIEGAAGPLRSVHWCPNAGAGSSLLLGASTGVYLMDPGDSAPGRTLVCGGSPSVRGGFNGVAYGGGRVLATHSELGIVRWDVEGDAPGKPLFTSMTTPAKAVRGVQVYDGHVYCAVDDRIIAWPLAGDAATPDRVYTGSCATVTAVCASAAGLFAGNSDGQVLHWRGLDTSRPEVLHAGSRRGVESVWLVSAGGVQRLIYTDTSLCVFSRVMGDTFACRYEASGQTLRRVDVASDLITATNDLRDRLLHWRPGSPAEPFAITQVGRLTGHSVQDVCLVGSAGAEGT